MTSSAKLKGWTKAQKANMAKSAQIDMESQRLIAMGREMERNDFIARVRRRLVHFRGFHPAYQEVFAELARTEKWLERRKRKAKRL